MIVFGGRPFKEVIKIKRGPIGGSKSNMTGVLIRRDQGIDTHIEERPREDTGRRQSAAS